MTQQLEKIWAGKIFNEDELKDYANFMENLKYRVKEKDKFSKNWANIIKEVRVNLNCDPTSKIGITIGKNCMGLVNHLYGKQFIALRYTIWEKGFKTGQFDNDHSLSPAIVTWLDQAISAYYKERIC